MVVRPMHLLTFFIKSWGNVLVLIFRPNEARNIFKQSWGKASIPAIIEGISQVLIFAGIVMSCAQLKTIIYCSGTVWSALGAYNS